MCVYARVQPNEINFQMKYFIEVTSTYDIQKNTFIGQGPTDQFFFSPKPKDPGSERILRISEFLSQKHGKYRTDIRQDQNLGPIRFSEKEFHTDAFKSACV